MDSVAKAIQDFVSSIYSHFFAFLTAMAAVGVITMAVLQAVKDMFPLRRAFQRQWLVRWFRCKADLANEKGAEFKLDPAKAESELIRLATDDNRNAFYDLQIEQLCGQFNAAIQVALDYPRKSRDLLIATAALADADDIRLVLNPPDAAKRPVNMADPNLAAKAAEDRQKFIDARSRVTHQVQRAIDSIQISAGFRWKFYLQVASFILSGTLAGLGVAMSTNSGTGGTLATAVVTGVLGGFLAPVARDLVAALQQLRK